MKFNSYWDLEGKHALLGASNYHWLGYDDEKFIQTVRNSLAVERGTRLHALAKGLINERVRLPRTKNTLNMYVNDAIGFEMTPEQILKYSLNAFGTADAISFVNGKLRIHDLKTGVTPANINQLKIYAALFCLNYGISPGDIDAELRIYQNNEIVQHKPKPSELVPIMDKIIRFDQIAEMLHQEEI